MFRNRNLQKSVTVTAYFRQIFQDEAFYRVLRCTDGNYGRNPSLLKEFRSTGLLPFDIGARMIAFFRKRIGFLVENGAIRAVKEYVKDFFCDVREEVEEAVVVVDVRQVEGKTEVEEEGEGAAAQTGETDGEAIRKKYDFLSVCAHSKTGKTCAVLGGLQEVGCGCIHFPLEPSPDHRYAMTHLDLQDMLHLYTNDPRKSYEKDVLRLTLKLACCVAMTEGIWRSYSSFKKIPKTPRLSQTTKTKTETAEVSHEDEGEGELVPPSAKRSLAAAISESSSKSSLSPDLDLDSDLLLEAVPAAVSESLDSLSPDLDCDSGLLRERMREVGADVLKTPLDFEATSGDGEPYADSSSTDDSVPKTPETQRSKLAFQSSDSPPDCKYELDSFPHDGLKKILLELYQVLKSYGFVRPSFHSVICETLRFLVKSLNHTEEQHGVVTGLVDRLIAVNTRLLREINRRFVIFIDDAGKFARKPERVPPSKVVSGGQVVNHLLAGELLAIQQYGCAPIFAATHKYVGQQITIKTGGKNFESGEGSFFGSMFTQGFVEFVLDRFLQPEFSKLDPDIAQDLVGPPIFVRRFLFQLVRKLGHFILETDERPWGHLKMLLSREALKYARLGFEQELRADTKNLGKALLDPDDLALLPEGSNPKKFLLERFKKGNRMVIRVQKGDFKVVGSEVVSPTNCVVRCLDLGDEFDVWWPLLRLFNFTHVGTCVVYPHLGVQCYMNAFLNDGPAYVDRPRSLFSLSPKRMSPSTAYAIKMACLLCDLESQPSSFLRSLQRTTQGCEWFHPLVSEPFDAYSSDAEANEKLCPGLHVFPSDQSVVWGRFVSSSANWLPIEMAFSRGRSGDVFTRLSEIAPGVPVLVLTEAGAFKEFVTDMVEGHPILLLAGVHPIRVIRCPGENVMIHVWFGPKTERNGFMFRLPRWQVSMALGYEKTEGQDSTELCPFQDDDISICLGAETFAFCSDTSQISKTISDLLNGSAPQSFLDLDDFSLLDYFYLCAKLNFFRLALYVGSLVLQKQSRHLSSMKNYLLDFGFSAENKQFSWSEDFLRRICREMRFRCSSRHLTCFGGFPERVVIHPDLHRDLEHLSAEALISDVFCGFPRDAIQVIEFLLKEDANLSLECLSQGYGQVALCAIAVHACLGDKRLRPILVQFFEMIPPQHPKSAWTGDFCVQQFIRLYEFCPRYSYTPTEEDELFLLGIVKRLFPNIPSEISLLLPFLSPEYRKRTAFEMLGMVGEGRESKVYKVGYNVLPGHEFAVKLRTSPYSSFRFSVAKEIHVASLLSRCEEPLVAKCYGCFMHWDVGCGDLLFALYEKAEGGDLVKWTQKLRSEKRLDDASKIVLQKMVIGARKLAKIHAKKIAQGDVKLENMVATSMDEDADILFIDFGHSMVGDQATRSRIPEGREARNRQQTFFCQADLEYNEEDGELDRRACDVYGFGVGCLQRIRKDFSITNEKLDSLIDNCVTPDWKVRRLMKDVACDLERILDEEE